MIECKVTGRVTCLPETVPDAQGLMCCRYYLKADKEGMEPVQHVKVIARQGQAYWAMANLKPGTRVRVKGKGRAMLSTVVIEQTTGRIITDG